VPWFVGANKTANDQSICSSHSSRFLGLEQSRISIDPRICHGKPVITGTRVLVANILGALAAGQSRSSIMQDYPSIGEADIDAALDFATQMTRFESFDYEPVGK
jgi:uncharacterized protein (DUF433 family)